MSGRIMSAQLVVPSHFENADRARNFDTYEKSGVGWRPHDSYLSWMSTAITCSSTVVAHQFPKAMVTSLPVFFHIDFLRMKRLFYLIIGDGVERPSDSNGQSNGRLTGRDFLLIYKDVSGKVVPYGKDSLYTKVLRCKNMFGVRFQQCKLKLEPFRAASVRIISKDYSVTYKEELLIEVGGLDYLEADHQWHMDSVRIDGPAKFFPDVRGSKHLLISSNIGANFVGPDAWFPATTNEFSADDCIVNPEKCKDGLSVSFWFKG
eukprot:Seg1833.2_Seg1833.3 transcript_id=Seg1833.2_Seg1833.3/GoldUCD/mRNA.D3Y31 product="hypothetical protein" protein_id=Seg1833.2_Seg1833.3/GoldUCD/D3Y31